MTAQRLDSAATALFSNLTTMMVVVMAILTIAMGGGVQW